MGRSKAATLCLLTVVAGQVSAPAQAIDLIDRVTATAEPSVFEGSCPASIKLEGIVTVGVPLGHSLKYYYRWESGDQVLTDEVEKLSKDRRERIETIWQARVPQGTSQVLPVRLHVYLGSKNGRTFQDYYSPPVDVRLSCKQ